MKENQLGLLIKEQRKRMGLSQKEVASQLSLNQSTYSNYENGYNQPPDNILETLSGILKTDWLARKNELISSLDEKEERDLFLKGYLNETEQIMFFEELTSFRRALDNLESKRTRREIADLFSQILDDYLELFHADKSSRKDLVDQSEKNLEKLNKKLIKVLLDSDQTT